VKVLILGGTQFLGRHLVEAALTRGHAVTLFNRGKTNPDLFPDVEKLRGERDGQLDALKGRAWDVAIDTCGYVPRIVALSARALADSVERYIFISSLSVFADTGQPDQDENGALATLADESTEQVTGETYGGLKVRCEQAAEAALPGRALIIRPGLIVGPHDPTWRFPYWVERVARGGEVLAPGEPQLPVQLIDARDLTAWIILKAETRQVGIYNATGPGYPLSMGQVLDCCETISGSDARFTWVSETFLLEQGVQPWSQLPLWVPAEAKGFHRFNINKAASDGLTFRPLDETVRDTLTWLRSLPPAYRETVQAKRGEGLASEREAELLAACHSRVTST
jgi:2'-hydroxyisoflavone reductase